MTGRSGYRLRTKLFTHLEKKHTFFVAVLLCLFQTVFSLHVYTQTAVVKGRVTTSRGTVQYALVTFEDENDITRRFSALTDVLGSYQLDIIHTCNSQLQMNVHLTSYVDSLSPGESLLH
jgi:hypothetical protein